jgi:hypothetical protein
LWAGTAESHVLKRLDRGGLGPRIWRPTVTQPQRVDDFAPLAASGPARVDEEKPDPERQATLYDAPTSQLTADGRIVRAVIDSREWPIRIA